MVHSDKLVCVWRDFGPFWFLPVKMRSCTVCSKANTTANLCYKWSHRLTTANAAEAFRRWAVHTVVQSRTLPEAFKLLLPPPPSNTCFAVHAGRVEPCLRSQYTPTPKGRRPDPILNLGCSSLIQTSSKFKLTILRFSSQEDS